MIPQGYRLKISAGNCEFLVVGWISYGQKFRPVVVPLDGESAKEAFLFDGKEFEVEEERRY